MRRYLEPDLTIILGRTYGTASIVPTLPPSVLPPTFTWVEDTFSLETGEVVVKEFVLKGRRCTTYKGDKLLLLDAAMLHSRDWLLHEATRPKCPRQLRESHGFPSSS